MDSLQLAVDAIARSSNVVLACHVNPDGDTLGSALALGHALAGMGKQTTVLSHDGVPDIYRWMPGAAQVQQGTARRDFDLAIVCDTGAIDRIGQAHDPVQSAAETLNIDHHLDEGQFGRIRLVDKRAAATGELVFDLIRHMSVPIDREIAECLLCAIITDTGSFKYLSVTPRTFRIAAELMDAGACPATINELVFENRSLASVKLLGRALDSLQVSVDGRVAWAHVRRTDFEEIGATDEETEGIVNHVRAVRGALVALLFREIPDRKIRVSLRSRDGFDVNQVANVFGGGGHRLAAGCSVDPPLEAAESALLAEVERRMKDEDEGSR